MSYGARSGSLPDKAQRSRSVSATPDRLRVRGRSPAFNALAAAFEGPKDRNLSTPPPIIRKLYAKSQTQESAKFAPKSSVIASLTSGFESFRPPKDNLIPRSIKGIL